jgi:hypothetical protein
LRELLNRTTTKAHNNNNKSYYCHFEPIANAARPDTQPQQNTTLDTGCRTVARLTMQTAFGVMPYKWQEDAVSHLLQMMNQRLGIAPAPVFLCQPTGGGKSLVRDTFAVTQGGITWCITPLLSLSADQKSKINMKTSENDDLALAVHLDELGTDAKRRGICKRLNALS